MTDKQRETEKFVGCILSVKTKPGLYGDVQHIIGTVREIDVDSSEQAIVLDQAMSNGEVLKDGYVLLSSQIADLQVMGRASEIQANLKSAYTRSDSVKSSSIIEDNLKGLENSQGGNVPYLNGGESMRNLNGNHMSNGSNPFNSITTGISDLSIGSGDDTGSHMIAKPKPRKPDNTTKVSTTPQKGLSQIGSSGSGCQFPAATSKTSTGKISTNIGLSTKSSDGDILMRTFGNLSGMNGPSGILNSIINSNKATTPVASKTNIAPSPSKLSPYKAPMYDPKKLGALSQFVNAENNEEAQFVPTAPRTPKNKNANNAHNDPKLARSQGKGNGRPQQQQRHGETFESMSKDEMAEDFDFEGSNAQFEKLPVANSKPTKVTKTPQFCKTDTTYLADRLVESITVRDAVTSVKQFVTDTGVAIPSVDLPTRSKILNLAHEAGLTHSRVVEVMGRAVAQSVIPMLGDSYRLSPERTEDRPWVLVCAGPHWQGAIGIATARILASLGVHTVVHAPKEELQLCATEEVLYSMSGGTLTRQIKDLKGYHFELVIMAMDDHLSRTLTITPYSRWLINVPVAFVDPPLISSYRQQLDAVGGGNQKCRKIVIVSPVLPIAYPSDSSVKIFLVNLGIPNDIFDENDVVYKSPFGDKLIIQIFSSSPK